MTAPAGGKIVPRDGNARLAALRLQALCDGILDASILLVYEARWGPAEHHVAKWVDHQAGKVTRGLKALEASPPEFDADSKALPNVGQIALACLLGYRDLRFDGNGAPIIRDSLAGSINSPRACRPMPRPKERRNIPDLWIFMRDVGRRAIAGPYRFICCYRVACDAALYAR